MIDVACPSCSANFRGKEEFAGKRVKCPKCGGRFQHPLISDGADVPPTQISPDTLVVQLLDMQWQPRPGIIVSQLKCYGCGIGSEYVYCYTYQSHFELAGLKKEPRYKIKVGMATDDPVSRIYGQVAVSKTSQSEPPIVLLIFKTLAARHLERWLHKRLEQASDAIGSEWFRTNPNELVDLYREYLRSASLRSTETNGPPTQPTSIKTARRLGRRAPPKSHGTPHYQQGHQIDDLLESSPTPLSIDEIAEKLGLTQSRVQKHIAYEISKDRSEIDSEGRIVVRSRRQTGQHRRDESGRTAKDHILLLWVDATVNDNKVDVDAWSQQFGVTIVTIRGWISCWTNYKGTTFTGKEGWPRITRTVLNDVFNAVSKGNSSP